MQKITKIFPGSLCQCWHCQVDYRRSTWTAKIISWKPFLQKHTWMGAVFWPNMWWRRKSKRLNKNPKWYQKQQE